MYGIANNGYHLLSALLSCQVLYYIISILTVPHFADTQAQGGGYLSKLEPRFKPRQS